MQPREAAPKPQGERPGSTRSAGLTVAGGLNVDVGGLGGGGVGVGVGVGGADAGTGAGLGRVGGARAGPPPTPTTMQPAHPGAATRLAGRPESRPDEPDARHRRRRRASSTSPGATDREYSLGKAMRQHGATLGGHGTKLSVVSKYITHISQVSRMLVAWVVWLLTSHPLRTRDATRRL